LFQKMIKRIFMLLIPIAMILFGIVVLNDRKYMLISLCIIGSSGLFFFLRYGRKGVKTSEIVLVCSLAAIATAGRVAFYWIPQFKPVTAVVIISAVTLGPEAGALVGTLAGFLSNFFFSQGPWTPYQMYAWGMIGAVTGWIFYKRKLHYWMLLFYGFVVTILIYGGILNFASILMFSTKMNLQIVLSYYISGVPFDLIHAFSTAVFLYFITNPFYETITRIKVKYGLLEQES